MRRFALSITAVVLGCAAGVVNAQLSAPPMVSALPDVSSISAANAAGVLHYCASHHLVSSTAADVLVRSPTERAALRTSPEFAAGNAGHIITQGRASRSPGSA